jgi:hypothetical protein
MLARKNSHFVVFGVPVTPKTEFYSTLLQLIFHPFLIFMITRFQNSHTYQKSSITAAKKPSQTLHPTPVFSAMRNILFIVPFNFKLVFSNVPFIFSASAEDSRISSPMAIVIYVTGEHLLHPCILVP